MEDTLAERINTIPIGYSEVLYNGRTYGLTREDYVDGESIKVFAKEQGGQDFISFNYYKTKDGKSFFRPCEMPEQKVLDFLNRYSTP